MVNDIISFLNEKYTELKKNTNILKNEMAFANVYCFAFNLDAEFDNSFKDLKFGLDIVTKNIAEIDNHFSVATVVFLFIV